MLSLTLVFERTKEAEKREIMSIEGYADYRRREFCKDIRCSVQLDLDARVEGSNEYQKIRQTCITDCIYTAYQFHHWLIEKGYLVIRPEE